MPVCALPDGSMACRSPKQGMLLCKVSVLQGTLGLKLHLAAKQKMQKL